MALAKEALPQLDTYQEVLRTFKQFDADGNGKIDIDEFTDLMGQLNPGWPDDKSVALFGGMDMDADGCLELEEFLGAIFGRRGTGGHHKHHKHGGGHRHRRGHHHKHRDKGEDGDGKDMFQIKLRGEWVNYRPDENEVLKRASLAGFQYAKFSLRGQCYQYDFKESVQINLGTNKRRQFRPPRGLQRPNKPIVPSGPTMVVIVKDGMAGKVIQVPHPRNKTISFAVKVPALAKAGQELLVPVPGLSSLQDPADPPPTSPEPADLPPAPPPDGDPPAPDDPEFPPVQPAAGGTKTGDMSTGAKVALGLGAGAVVVGGGVAVAGAVLGADGLADVAGGAADVAGDVAGDAADVIADQAGDIGDAMGDAAADLGLDDVAADIGATVGDAAGDAGDVIADLGGDAADVIGDVAGDAGDLVSGAVGDIDASAMFGDATDAIADMGGDVGDFIMDLF